MIQRNEQGWALGYHVQESQGQEMSQPCICTRDDAWLGMGYYFWLEEAFADYWGQDKLRVPTAKATEYEVYSAYLDLAPEHTLNTTFNEDDYFEFASIIDDAVARLLARGYEKVTLKAVHDLIQPFFHEKGIKTLVYDDLPQNPWGNPNRKYSLVLQSEESTRAFLYKKRIQAVVYDIGLIRDFSLYKVGH